MEVSYTKELNAKDLDQVSGGIVMPFHDGVCEDCRKKGQVTFVSFAGSNGKNLCADCGEKYFDAQNYKTGPVVGI